MSAIVVRVFAGWRAAAELDRWADGSIHATEMTTRRQRKRHNRDLHFLNEHGMIACNPRDREAAHRAEVEGIATENLEAVTCKKCWAAIRNIKGLRSSGSTP